MSIFADKNLYPGVNAHLNSFLQAYPGEYSDFHSKSISVLAQLLDERLPENYYAREETGLQIHADADTEQSPTQRSRPDVSIYATQPSTEPAPATRDAAASVLPLTVTLTDKDYFTSVVIYRVAPDILDSRPVTRIELLSGANKPPRASHRQYVEKRDQTLRSGVCMVEIDYLHQSRPAVPGIPSYVDADEKAYPYYILVSDPRPDIEQGIAYIYPFGVDDPIPVVSIPLSGAETLRVDFGEIYARVYERSRFFRRVVDYATEPLQFDAYRPADRDLIRHRLRQIATAHQGE